MTEIEKSSTESNKILQSCPDNFHHLMERSGRYYFWYRINAMYPWEAEEKKIPYEHYCCYLLSDQLELPEYSKHASRITIDRRNPAWELNDPYRNFNKSRFNEKFDLLKLNFIPEVLEAYQIVMRLHRMQTYLDTPDGTVQE